MKLGVVIGGCVSAALLYLAVPMAVSAIQLLPGDVAASLVRRGALLSDSGMARLIDTRRAGLRWHDAAEPHGDIAALLVSVVLAQRTGNATVEEVLDRARGEARAALTLSPADAGNWQLLASIELLAGRQSDAARALAMSYRTNPHSAALGLARTTTGLNLWNDLDPATRPLVLVELKDAFRSDRELILQQAMNLGRMDVLRQSVQDDEVASRRLRILMRAIEGEMY